MSDIDVAALRAAAENPMRMTTFDGHVSEWVSVKPEVMTALLDELAGVQEELATAESMAEYWRQRTEASWEREEYFVNQCLINHGREVIR